MNILESIPRDTVSTDREKIVEWARRWGGATADALLDEATQIFTLPSKEGFIGYRAIKKSVVVYGEPVCAPENLEEFVEKFHKFCHDKKSSITYVITSEKFARWSLKHGCKAFIEFGEELVLDPASDDPRRGQQGALVRKKIKRAQHEGLTVKEYRPKNAELEEQMNAVGKAWLSGRQGPQVYISHLRIFNDPYGRRWFYAQQGQKIVGVLMMNKVEARNGWAITQIMLVPNAPMGTPEVLVVGALEALTKEDCTFVTFGAVPAKEMGEIVGLNGFYEWVTRLGYKAARAIFHLDGKKAFWQKFQPRSEKAYLVFSESSISQKEILGLMRALNISF